MGGKMLGGGENGQQGRCRDVQGAWNRVHGANGSCSDQINYANLCGWQADVPRCRANHEVNAVKLTCSVSGGRQRNNFTFWFVTPSYEFLECTRFRNVHAHADLAAASKMFASFFSIAHPAIGTFLFTTHFKAHCGCVRCFSIVAALGCWGPLPKNIVVG